MLESISYDAVGLLEGARAIRQATRAEAPTKEEVNESVRIAVDRVRKIRPEMADIAVEERLDPHLPKLALPRNRLIDTLENLITNAADAMTGEGTLTLTTSLTARDKRKYLAVSVADTGCGIPKEDLTKIFALFFSKKPGGLGFGLWRDKNFVKEIGGEIEVESEVGKGSKFTILLPVPVQV
jgi:signal transduction histidine kinase